MKIVDIINKKIADGKTFFSFEFFPPRTEEGVDNLFERMERMVAYGPVFCDITWGAGGSTADVTLDIAAKMQDLVCIETMMHLTCTNMPVEKLQHALEEVKSHGIQNILALRGDPPKGQEKFEAVEGGFSCALDLVKYIRTEFGDHFGICVAGYPEAHPDTIVEDPEQMDKNYWANIDYLKQKVEAGGDLIITQLFYDVDIFLKFVKDCRSVGIKAPIVPGIMPIMTYAGFKRMTGFCKTKVPQAIADTLESIKDNDEAVRSYGIELGAEMCRRLLAEGVPGLHMYSLNLERSALGILERLGWLDASRVPRSLPWQFVPAGSGRVGEGVRPVFWSQRPRSYIKRSQGWASFPASRLSEAASLASIADQPALVSVHSSNEARRAKSLESWGAEVTSAADVAAVFCKYLQGEIAQLPWAESTSTRPSASLVKPLLGLLDRGLLPVNAQPAVNGAPSTDATAGWGAPGGYVYAKGFVEVFCPAEAFKALLPKLQAAGDRVTYLAATPAGEVQTNLATGRSATVSWGVFPGGEVVQPLVADAAAFAAWAPEAYALWTADWAACYEEGSASQKVLKDIAASYVLLHVIDNDYVSGDLFSLLA